MSDGLTDAVYAEIERRGLSAEEAAAAGLCELHEALVVTVQTPLAGIRLIQNYRRPDAANQHRVELVGEAMELDEEIDGVRGRLSALWLWPSNREAVQ
jgi:hypothetical protein